MCFTLLATGLPAHAGEVLNSDSKHVAARAAFKLFVEALKENNWMKFESCVADTVKDHLNLPGLRPNSYSRKEVFDGLKSDSDILSKMIVVDVPDSFVQKQISDEAARERVTPPKEDLQYTYMVLYEPGVTPDVAEFSNGRVNLAFDCRDLLGCHLTIFDK